MSSGTRLKKYVPALLLLAAGLLLTTPLRAQTAPTDNPIATRYGADAYPWTDEIRWNNVFNVLDYGGVGDGTTPNDAALAAAMEAARAAGGGVVYLPAGTYYFAENVYVRPNVVLRGDRPLTRQQDARFPGFVLPTRLVFPRYNPTFTGAGTPNETAFRHIYTQNPRTDSNLGLVHLDINRAGVMLAEPHSIKFSAAFDPNTYTNRNLVVWGARVNNAAFPEQAGPDVPGSAPVLTFTSGGETLPFQNAWQRHVWRFGANIEVIARENALVANNRCADLSLAGRDDGFEQIGYVIRQNNTLITLDQPGQARFRHSDLYGISVNGLYHFGRLGAGTYGTPDRTPYNFRTGIAVRDNWVYCTKGAAIEASGQNLVVSGNITRDQPNKQLWVNAQGTGRPTGSSFAVRSTLLGGYDVVSENNDIAIYSWLVENGPYFTNDGEALMMDNTTTLVNGWTVRNNTIRTNKPLYIFKVPSIQNVLIENNTTAGIIEVLAVPTNSVGWASNVRLLNNTTGGNLALETSANGAGNNVVAGNTSTGRGAITVFPSITEAGAVLDRPTNIGWVPARPIGLTHSDLTSTSVTLFWNDASERGMDETGYQILRNDAPIPGAATNADQTTITLTGLTPNTNYALQVRAFNQNGNSASSLELRFRTPL